MANPRIILTPGLNSGYQPQTFIPVNVDNAPCEGAKIVPLSVIIPFDSLGGGTQTNFITVDFTYLFQRNFSVIKKILIQTLDTSGTDTQGIIVKLDSINWYMGFGSMYNPGPSSFTPDQNLIFNCSYPANNTITIIGLNSVGPINLNLLFANFDIAPGYGIV